MNSPAVDGSIVCLTMSSVRSSKPGTVFYETTRMAAPSKCLHLRSAALPPPNTVTFTMSVDRYTGILGTDMVSDPLQGLLQVRYDVVYMLATDG